MVVAAVVDGVVLSEEHVPKDPQGLAVMRGQVCGADVHGAELVSILVVL